MNIDKFTITSYDQIAGFKNGTLMMLLDELNDFTLSQEEEKTAVEGKGGRTVINLKRNKKVTGSGTNGFLCGGALAAMVGAEVETDSAYPVMYTDRISVTSNKGETACVAVGTAGNEIGTIYVRNDDNVYISGGTKLTQVSTTPSTSGEFSYDLDSKEITFYAGDVTDGTEVIAFYYREAGGQRITNDSENYSEVLELFIDVTCKDACDDIFHGQLIIPRGDMSGTFDLQGGTDATALDFEFESLPDICLGSTKLWDFIVFD